MPDELPCVRSTGRTYACIGGMLVEVLLFSSIRTTGVAVVVLLTSIPKSFS